ncbi:unnamed protein product [Boreogadus saida]
MVVEVHRDICAPKKATAEWTCARAGAGMSGLSQSRSTMRTEGANGLPGLFIMTWESICAAQLITEDEGLGRLAHTLQVLVDLAPTAASHRRASRPEPLRADRLSTAPSFS